MSRSPSDNTHEGTRDGARDGTRDGARDGTRDGTRDGALAHAADATALPPARGHVLVVDDHAPLADNLRALLADDSSGVEVTVLGSGQAALAIARTRGFDVAIVDVKLPDGSGVDLLPQLRQAAPLGEVILITGFATIDAAIAALRGGAFAFLLKSFRPEELRSTVDQALVKVALRRERDLLERRYRALVEAADVVVIGVDRHGRAVLVNPKFSALTGVSPGDAVGRDVAAEWVALADRGRFSEAIASAAASRAPRELEAMLVPTPGTDADPSGRLIRWHLSPEGGDNAPLYEAAERASTPARDGALVFGIGVDVTDRRRLERRAANAEAISTMGTLALGLAHEIRNPLNAAVLQMHLLGRQVEREVGVETARASMRDRVQIVVGEIKRLGRLLGEFLELARPRGLAREPIDVEELVRGVLDLHHEEASSRAVTITASFEGPQLRVVGDREKLRQVLVNLLVNALDATPSEGTISVRAHAVPARPAPAHPGLAGATDAHLDAGGPRTLAIDVVDSGSGIAEPDLARLFDPFFTTKPGGTGLGLSIVRKILEQHGGTIELRSRLGEGTTAQVTLPIVVG